MTAAEISDVGGAITMRILAGRSRWKLGYSAEWPEIRHQICRILAPHKARHENKKEAATLLELALWKAKIVAEGAHLKIREECHVTCGVDCVIPGVLSFL